MIPFCLASLESDDDKQMFVSVYKQYHLEMERTAMKILRNQCDAEDSVQNAFLQVIRHFEKIDQIPSADLPYWLICIVKHEALTILRKKKREETIEDWPAYSEKAAEVSDYDALVELFSELPDTYRQVLEMKILLGYTDPEIAEHLGLSVSAVSTRASRGRKLLREIIQKEGLYP